MAVTGTFDEIVALEPQHEKLLRAIRSLVHAIHPDACEVCRPGDRAASWGWGPKKMSEAYVYALPYTHHVNLGFYRGASLADPAGLLTGTGKAMRHIRLTDSKQLENPALRALMAQARDERRAALNT
ncbi:DUF1801 domain-containing protein [Marinovum sp.]|uniref:DUF1801 domain-containing protein n=1 Tax=Marinovum sp. TaxID=2024839 RepID=UPI003A8F013B